MMRLPGAWLHPLRNLRSGDADRPGREPTLSELAEYLPDNVMRFDRSLRVIYANHALLAAFGVTIARLRGRTVKDMPGLRPFHDALGEVLATGETAYLEVEVSRNLPEPPGFSCRVGTDLMPSGEHDAHIDQVHLVAERDRAGRVVGVLAIGRDVTPERRSAAARETALREANELATAKSAFLANMSHEIRTPLNAVLGMAQIGLNESRGRKALTRFAAILDAGQLLLGLVNDILDFSKIEAGRLSLDVGPVDLGRVVDRAVDMTAGRAWAKGLDLLVDETASLPGSFLGDELRIVQILVNLLSNAAKFTEEGGIYLGIRVENESLVFTVTDTGIGMTEEQISRLFVPFEQADATTTRRFGGTGLGLAISRRLAALMAGEISVRSKPGAGSEFEFRMPLQAPEGAAGAAGNGRVVMSGLCCSDSLSEALNLAGVETRVVAPSRAFSEPGDLIVVNYDQLFESQALARARVALDGGKRLAVLVPPGNLYAIPAGLRDAVSTLDWPPRARHVLAVLSGAVRTPAAGAEVDPWKLKGVRVLAADDNELNRVVLKEMLAMMGAKATCVDDGQALVDRLEREGSASYDIVVTDVEMPGMDGLEATRRIRAMAPDIPVIGLTAHALDEARARCLAAGMSMHVGKPVSMNALANAILSQLKREPVTKSLERPGRAVEDALPVVDWAGFDETFPHSQEMVAQLCGILLKRHRETPSTLLRLLESGGREELARMVHNLKGMLGNVMAVEAQAAAVEANRLIKDELPGVDAAVYRLADAMNRLLAEVAQRYPG